MLRVRIASALRAVNPASFTKQREKCGVGCDIIFSGPGAKPKKNTAPAFRHFFLFNQMGTLYAGTHLLDIHIPGVMRPQKTWRDMIHIAFKPFFTAQVKGFQEIRRRLVILRY